jgi:hypothetical protein
MLRLTVAGYLLQLEGSNCAATCCQVTSSKLNTKGREPSMKTFLSICLFCTLLFTLAPQAQAENTSELLEEAIGLLKQENYTEAREVIAIALDQIDHRLLDKTAATFPETVGDFSRGDVNTQKAMGIDITECTYTDEKGNEIQVQLMGGGDGMFGGLAALGASFGGGRKVRIQGRSGSVMDSDGEVTLSLQLKNGKSLIFTSNMIDGDGVSNFAEQFPVVEVDESGS